MHPFLTAAFGQDWGRYEAGQPDLLLSGGGLYFGREERKKLMGGGIWGGTEEGTMQASGSWGKWRVKFSEKLPPLGLAPSSF